MVIIITDTCSDSVPSTISRDLICICSTKYDHYDKIGLLGVQPLHRKRLVTIIAIKSARQSTARAFTIYHLRYFQLVQWKHSSTPVLIHTTRFENYSCGTIDCTYGYRSSEDAFPKCLSKEIRSDIVVTHLDGAGGGKLWRCYLLATFVNSKLIWTTARFNHSNGALKRGTSAWLTQLRIAIIGARLGWTMTSL
jgi:hypothetical protein